MGAFFEALVNHSDRIFSALLNRAVAATLLILAVCVYRALSPKAPKWSRLFLWALAGLRLCLPFSIRSAWSLVPSEKILDYETAQYAAKPEITSGIAALNQAVNPAFGESFAATPAASVNPLQVWMHLAGTCLGNRRSGAAACGAGERLETPAARTGVHRAYKGRAAVRRDRYAVSAGAFPPDGLSAVAAVAAGAGRCAGA